MSGSNGSEVNVHTPCSSLCMTEFSTPSQCNWTSLALGAGKRNVTLPSG